MTDWELGYNAALTEIADFLNTAILKYGNLVGITDGDINTRVTQRAMMTFCGNLRDLVNKKMR